ncbi:hypothetical protein TRFO_15976 [Tritrichomonas foetus]|uniref:Initiator binding domain-containing protein n=1 Tax=Tritrichomonas foetus TaxID=1144522 RepID=A0A1J4KVK0_9EUKA|nr:hypothetical protein TRFO_15976 [Tritrichomonas foetus]|eukprot:OHT13764.1 hypothetical protein TRFO_15976 [Tritrichomonas foetus]
MSTRYSLEPALKQPNFIHLLSERDRKQYNALRTSFSKVQKRTTKTHDHNSLSRHRNNDVSNDTHHHIKNSPIETFKNSLLKIQRFAKRGDSDDWKRSLACGIAWIDDNNIVINTRQLRLLLFKCKSSINGSLQKIGYTKTIGRSEALQVVQSIFPLINGNLAELRKWSMRVKEKNYEPKMNSESMSSMIQVDEKSSISYDVKHDGSIDLANNVGKDIKIDIKKDANKIDEDNDIIHKKPACDANITDLYFHNSLSYSTDHETSDIELY